MDIKEIALRLLAEEFPGMHQENQAFMVEFAEALIESYKAELLKEVGEPVAVTNHAQLGYVTDGMHPDIPLAMWAKETSYSGANIALYTSDQVAAAIIKRTQPWRMTMVFGPIERILHRLESEGTVEVAGRHVVFKEDGRGGWYDAVAALRGVIEFHQLAQSRYGYPADVEALIKFANKLEAGAPIFEADLAQVRACIASCKRQALQLRLSQADDIVKTIQISMRLEEVKVAA